MLQKIFKIFSLLGILRKNTSKDWEILTSINLSNDFREGSRSILFRCKENFVSVLDIRVSETFSPGRSCHSTSLLDDRLSLTRVRQPRAISRSPASRPSNGIARSSYRSSKIGEKLIIVSGKTRRRVEHGSTNLQ